MWYCKMYFPGRHEVIESDAFGTQGAPSQRKVFPFLESLLSFTELDIGKVAVALRCISDDLESLDRERVTNAMVRLGALAEMHSFFRAHWMSCGHCRRSCRCTKSKSSGSLSWYWI